MAKNRICSVEGCGKKNHSLLYCATHQAKFRAYGDPLAGKTGPSPGEPMRWIRDHAQYEGDDCIKWPYEIGRYGYGTVKCDGKKRVASRVMCEIAHGLAPDKNYDAAHSCGNGHHGCMNPRHLSWKTRKENMADAIRHGTWMRGERVPSSKLTTEQVLEIRALEGTALQRDIGKTYGVSENTISRILARKRWGWL